MYDEQSPNPPPQSTNPAVSVIIPMYNSANYIGEALDSLLAQTLQDFEVIVVDDCSTDNSVDVAEEYAPKFGGRLRLAKMETEKNSGRASFPRNKGMKLAKGEYLTFLDPDDTFAPEALEVFYNFAKEYVADVVHCEKWYQLPEEFYNDAERRKEVKPFSHPTEYRRYVTEPKLLSNNPEERVLDFCRRRWLTWAVWLQFVRRELILENKITFPNTVTQDLIFITCELCVAKNYLVISNTLCWYRIRQESAVRKVLDDSEKARRLASEFRSAINHLDEFLNRQELFAKRADIKYALFEAYTVEIMNRYGGICKDALTHELDEFLRKGFGGNDNAVDSYFLNMFGKSYRKPLPISVIIPMYNAEKYIAECLESVLSQTLREFEVIVVDDCSTDKSVEIVRSYARQFGGRLKLAKTSSNSGGPGEPSNLGVDLSRGEYLFIMDDDDTIAPDALEKLYRAAKKFKADLVTCEKYYRVPEENWNDAEYRKTLEPSSYQRCDLVEEPTLVPFKMAQRVQDCYDNKVLHELWNKLIRRDYFVENQIRLTNIINADYLTVLCLVYTAKRFVRVPYAINYYRVREDSLYNSHQNCEPLQKLKAYVKALNVGFKYLDTFLSKREFFQKNPEVKRLAFNSHLKNIWNARIQGIYDEISAHEREEVLQKEFGGSDNIEFVRFFFDFLFDFERNRVTPVPSNFKPFISARVDIKLMTTEGDFKILSVSDRKATVWKPTWFQGGGIGYQLQSYAGKLDFTAKATVDGQIQFWLRGLDIRDPEDNSKKIPYWIDYTKLTVNDEVILDTLTPIWCFKPYLFDMKVKAGEEIKIHVEWLPHKNDTP